MILMRCLAFLCFCLAAAALAAPGLPQDDNDSFRIYGVHIERTPKQPWTGLGIYLGRGYVLTPAHVAGLGFWRNPRVEVEGRDLPTKVLKDGHFHNVDITFLGVDEQQLPVRLGMRRLALCQNAPWVGEDVVVATRENAARSHVMSPYLLPPNTPAKFSAVIPYAPETASSGSGVFDPNRKCLLGIVSGKIQRDEMVQEDGRLVSRPRDVATYFVPASTIADFIPSTVPF
jgi:hypothetical protein